MRTTIAGFTAALLLATAANAQDAAALAQASTRGRLIYAYDRAAWLGTDDLLAKLRDPAGKVAGYVVEGPADTPKLTFFDKAAEPRAVYVARFDKGRLVEGKVLGDTDDRTIAPATRRMIAALATARTAIVASSDSRPCGKAPFNTVVLPPATPDAPVPVYFLTPQPDTASFPIGGHFEIDVAADGKPGAIRRFAESCLAIPTKPPPEAKNARDAAVVVSHVLDPTPTEIHVFASLAIHTPVFVMIANPDARLWPVVGDRIRPPRPIGK